MTELWLNFIDETGEAKRILVSRERFIVGRHSSNDLAIPNSKLSREHLEIECFGDVFTVSDCGSSNGTTLNGEDLTEPVSVKDGDRLNLGGGLDIEVELIADNNVADNPVTDNHTENIVENRPAQQVQSVSPAPFGNISSNFFYLAPALGLLVLLFVGGLFFAFSGNAEDSGNENNETAEVNERDETNNRINRRTPGGGRTPTPSPTASNEINSSTSPTPVSNGSPNTIPVSSEIEKVKKNAEEFLKRIAQNDANPFLDKEQAEKVNEKIKNFRNSSALAENLRAVKNNASEFQTLAASQNLKPQFLATAALNEIGNRSGNPTETARTMLPILGKLKIPLGNDLADDNLLIIAAYDQGKQGKFYTLQSKMEGLSKTLANRGQPANPRVLRTIWFLKKYDKLTDAEFQYAVNFLAVGIIMQNPKEFGVNADAVVF